MHQVSLILKCLVSLHTVNHYQHLRILSVVFLRLKLEHISAFKEQSLLQRNSEALHIITAVI